MNNNFAIEVNNLTVSYSKKPALKGIDLKIPHGKIVGIIGPNGAGKSTLIKGMLGLIPLDSGEIKVFGKSLKENFPRISYIPQRESFDWDFPVVVQDVVMMGRYPHLKLFQKISDEDKAKVKAALQKVEMLEYAERQIRLLSGGQQQRIFIARALAQESDILFLDEPFVGIDAATETTIFAIMRKLKSEGKTILVVHHDLGRVTDYFDLVILINQRLIAYGKTSEKFNRDNLIKTYGGRLTILDKTEQLRSQTIN